MKTMVCECGKSIEYSEQYKCYDCTCGKCYNAVGNKLAPLRDWKDYFDGDY